VFALGMEILGALASHEQNTTASLGKRNYRKSSILHICTETAQQKGLAVPRHSESFHVRPS